MKRGSVMPKSIFILAATLVLAGIAMLSTVSAEEGDKDKEDTLVCYTWDIFPNERFKLNVVRHSPLSEKEEEQKFQHPKQTAYSVHGKHVIRSLGMSAADGTVVTAKDAGSHMGLHSIFVRGDGSTDFARPVTIDCTADDDRAVPRVWDCESRNEFDIYHGFSRLTKVDETKDPLCSCFQDSKFICNDDWHTREEPASVLKQ